MDNFIHERADNVRDNYITGRREILFRDKVVEFYSAEMVKILNENNPSTQPPFGFFIEEEDGNQWKNL